MKSLAFLFLTFFVFLSCQQGGRKEVKEIQNESTKLKDYQRYALDGIKNADYWDQAFPASDSFYLWSFDDFGKQFPNNRITRTLGGDFYHYLFWTTFKDTVVIYEEDSIPIAQFFHDTLYEANGDNYKDLLITYNPGPTGGLNLTHLFLFDTIRKQFCRIKEIENIPNIDFQAKAKTFTGEYISGSTHDIYKFKWSDNLKFDTVYIRKSRE